MCTFLNPLTVDQSKTKTDSPSDAEHPIRFPQLYPVLLCYSPSLSSQIPHFLLCFLPVLITCPALLVFTCVKLSISVLAHKLQSHCAFVLCQFVLVPLCQAFQPYTLCVYFLVLELCLHYSASAYSPLDFFALFHSLPVY